MIQVKLNRTFLTKVLVGVKPLVSLLKGFHPNRLMRNQERKGSLPQVEVV